MAVNCQSTSTARVPNNHANENVTSPATLPGTLPPAGDGPSPGPGQHPAPAPPYAEHGMEGVGYGSVTPPPSYAEPNAGLIIGDTKTPPYAYNSPPPSLRSPEKQDHGGVICIRALKEPSSLQRLRDRYGDNDSAGPDTTRLVQALMPSCCATSSTLGSKSLNYHVNHDNDVYRWQVTDIPIPVGIDLFSFDSSDEACMAQTCLIAVLERFNASNVGLKFQFVNHPSNSAFFVRFGGDHTIYANAFFPGSHPKDWYIDVFRPGLTLSEDQEQFLMSTRREDISAAKAQALEQNLVKILMHEMLHVVGVRHCDAQETETMERCVRYPHDLSDDKNNEDCLMERSLDWRTFSQLDWMNRTLQEIREIYAMKGGDYLGSHKIRDVSWEDGAKQRKEIALQNARCCVA